MSIIKDYLDLISEILIYYRSNYIQILNYSIASNLKGIILASRGQPNTRNEQSSEEEDPLSEQTLGSFGGSAVATITVIYDIE